MAGRLDQPVSLRGAGPDGLVYETSDGARYGSLALIGAKAPLTSWMGRHTKADSTADVIMAAGPGSGRNHPPPSGEPLGCDWGAKGRCSDPVGPTERNRRSGAVPKDSGAAPEPRPGWVTTVRSR